MQKLRIHFLVLFALLILTGSNNGEDVSIRAAGLDVIDFSMRQRIRSWVDFNLSIDNLANKKYFETQNFFESRVQPVTPVIAQIHGTPSPCCLANFFGSLDLIRSYDCLT